MLCLVCCDHIADRILKDPTMEALLSKDASPKNLSSNELITELDPPKERVFLRKVHTSCHLDTKIVKGRK